MRGSVWSVATLVGLILGIAVFLWNRAERLGEESDRRDLAAAQRVSSEDAESVAAAPSAVFAAERPVFEIPTVDEISSLPPHPDAEALGGDEIAAADEPRVVLTVFRAYRDAFGSYPTGEGNADLMRALLGGNPDKRVLFPRASPRLNGEGELLDGFGTAYFFHQVSSRQIEVRSAGVDQEFYTEDDVVAAD